RRRPLHRDPDTLYCAAFFDPPQKSPALELERCRLWRGDFYLHSGADSGVLQLLHQFDHWEQRRARGALMVSAKDSKGEVKRRQYFEGITNASEIMRVSRQFPNVVSCSPVLRGTVSARAGFENATVDLFGIDPALHAQTTDILQKLIAGNYDDFRNNTSSLILGSRLAEDLLQVGVGDTVQLLAPNGEYWRFTVAAIARAGIGSIDASRVYCHARVAQALLQQPSGASIIIYKLRDPDRAPALAQHFETLFQHGATSWQDREESTLQLFLTLRMSVAITTSLIIL